MMPCSLLGVPFLLAASPSDVVGVSGVVSVVDDVVPVIDVMVVLAVGSETEQCS